MTRKTVLTTVFLTITGTAVTWEIVAAQNPRDDLLPWTTLLVDHVPVPITLAAIALLVAWLPQHFVEAYAKKGKAMTDVPATPPPGAPHEPLVTPTTVVSLASAFVAVLVVFGVPLSDEQTFAILGLVAVAAPLVLAVWSRRKVYAPATVRAMVVDAAVTGEVRTEPAAAEPAPNTRAEALVMDSKRKALEANRYTQEGAP